MRKMLIVIAGVLAAVQGAASADRSLARGERVPGAPWVMRAVAPAAVSSISAEASAVAARPIVLLETNYYTFLPGERVQLRLTLHPNGYAGATTIYLYNENRTTGERHYYSIPGGGLLTGTNVADLFGPSGTPVPIAIPELSDFVLLGTASDPAALSWGVNGALGGSIPVPAGQPGLHQFVVEIRDAAGKRVISRSNAMYSYVEQSVNLTGTITTSATLTANRRYILNDFVGVAEPAVLTIEPGTVIYGGDGRATLFIRRGARIVANGTARRPIIFTSPQRIGSRAQRDWGGLVLLGRAPINEPSGQGTLEGVSGTEYAFGGTNSADNSGVLRFVRLEFGGFLIEANQEINGLTLAGVGNGTTIEYIEVLHNKDDAFEFFGGTVNARYLLSVAAADDSIDYDLGYQGDIQFVAVVKRGVNDENDGNIVVEGDGHPQNFTLTPKTNPRMFNVTGYGTGRTDVGAYGNVLRRGVAGKIYNMILTGGRFAPLTIRDDASFNNASSGDLVVDSSILFGNFEDSAFGNSADRGAQTRTFLFTTMTRNRNADPMLAVGAPSAIKTLMPDLTPLDGSPALDVSFVANPPDNGFFEPVDFIGAVGPGNNWVLSGWATFSDN